MNFMSKLKVPEEDFCKYMNKVSNFIYEEKYSHSKSSLVRTTTNFLVDLSQRFSPVKDFI